MTHMQNHLGHWPRLRRFPSDFPQLISLVVATVLLAATFAGCGGDRASSAKAAGKVTHQGQPVTVGEIHFVQPESGDAGSAPLDPTGAYSLKAGIPPGKYRVFVVPPSSLTQPPVPGESVAQELYFPNIPVKCRSEVSSGLTAEIKAGSNTFDFDLQ